jgi:hypothetical protein
MCGRNASMLLRICPTCRSALFELVILEVVRDYSEAREVVFEKASQSTKKRLIGSVCARSTASKDRVRKWY